MKKGAALTDGWVVAAAIATVVGAWLARPVPVLAVLVGGAVVAAVRRPIVLIVLLAGGASALGARAWAGMAPPPVGAVSGVATLITDPIHQGNGTQAVIRLQDRHLDAWAYGAVGAQLEGRLAGERVRVEGHIDAGRVPPSFTIAHVAGRVSLHRVDPVGGGHLLHRAANIVRRTLTRGAWSMDRDERALYTGLVIGDDRDQSMEVTDDFLGAGLTHLLAVSGQNVAFVLAVATPLTKRLGWRLRLGCTIAIIVLFATITRFEPSVLRAAVMAALACTASTIGRPAPAIRILALAVISLVLVDPFLVRSVGFGLSVGACLGIILLTEPIAAWLVGPEWLRRALAVVAAAQLGVAPLLVTVFGGVPVASLPANLLAEPVAGFVMMWGATAGLVAGLVPALAVLVHVPTTLALWWIAHVARVATDAGFGELDGRGIVLVVACGLAAVAARRRGRALLAAFSAASLVATLLVPGFLLRRSETGPREIVGVGTLWRAGDGTSILVAAPDSRPATALRALRSAGIHRLDLLVSATRSGALEATLAERVEIRRVWPGSEHLGVGDLFRQGLLVARVEQVTPSLRVSVGERDPPA
jgi:competence protein ComEC